MPKKACFDHAPPVDSTSCTRSKSSGALLCTDSFSKGERSWGAQNLLR
jgi:hypothetical protein